MKHAAIMEWAEDIGQRAIIKKDVEIPLGLLPDEKVEEIAQGIKGFNPGRGCVDSQIHRTGGAHRAD
jgi:hypothetical protein